MSDSPVDLRQHVSERTSREYETMVRAVLAMEEALASPAPGRERAWKDRIRRELAVVTGLLQEHCSSAEDSDGLLTQVESALGRSYEVMEARREHDRLVHEAVTLLAALEEFPDEEPLTYQQVRSRAAGFTAALRRHQAREADLLMLAYARDVGVGD
jgi:hypothetical protein